MATNNMNVYECKKCTTRITAKNEPLRCKHCGEYDTYALVSSTASSTSASGSAVGAVAGLKSGGAVPPASRAKSVSELNATPVKRIPTNIPELDRVLGGGFVEREVVLLAASPGSGKSTLAMHVADSFAQRGMKVLYSSGEESEQQIGLRAQRLGVSSDLIKVVNVIDLEKLLGYIEEEKPDLLVVDSIQTLATNAISGSMGGLAQSKEVAHRLTNISKEKGIITILIGQATKE